MHLLCEARLIFFSLALVYLLVPAPLVEKTESFHHLGTFWKSIDQIPGDLWVQFIFFMIKLLYF